MAVQPDDQLAHLRSVSDDEDLRPSEPINTEQLRGEVDRASGPDDDLLSIREVRRQRRQT